MECGSRMPIPATSATNSLKYPCIDIKFIDSWFKSLDVQYNCCFKYYSNKMNKIFNKIPNTMPVKTSPGFKGKHQLLSI